MKWKGYPESENSWVRESDAPYVPLSLTELGTNGFDLCRNADEMISKFLDEKRAKQKGKKAAKPRKSTEASKQEPKKRGRISTKSKADSDEEPEPSPVRPITKKQKKAPASTKKAEPTRNDEAHEMLSFESMDKYMSVSSWEDLVDKIDTIERDEEGNLFIYGSLWVLLDLGASPH